jgi:hypothetical protein
VNWRFKSLKKLGSELNIIDGVCEDDKIYKVGGRIILKRIFEKWDGGMDCIDVAQNREKWRAVVNAVMNLRVAYKAGDTLTS